MQLTQLPASPFNLPVGVIGFDDQTWLGQPLPLLLDSFGFTSCQAWLAPETFTALSNLGGTATWTIAVPLDLDLAGLSFYVQATVNAPTANPGAFVFTNAGHGVVGTP